MKYVVTFLPWIVYVILPSERWQWAASASLVVAVGVIVRQRSAGYGPDSLIIESGSAVFFAVLAAVAFANPGSELHPYSAALSSGVLALIAGVSLVVGKPFTLGIAKRSTPPEVWSRPLFVQANIVITTIWTLAFAVTAAVLALLAYAHQSHSTTATAAQTVGFVGPMMFTKRYVATNQTRPAQPHGER